MDRHKLDNCDFRVVGKKLLIEVRQATEKTESGIYKPDTVKDREEGWTNFGVLKAMGAEVKDVPYEVGDTLVFGRYYGVDLTLDGKRYRLMRPEDVLGIDK